MNMLNLSENILRLRRERKITQEELADFAGVTKASVSKWESGKSTPDVMLLPLLASFFDVTLDELVGYEPQLSKEQIRRIYGELCSDFAALPFSEAKLHVEEYARRYYSCYLFLLQLAILYLNHFMLAPEREEGIAMLRKAEKYCMHIEARCEDLGVKQDAISVHAILSIQLGKPREAIDRLEMLADPMRISNQNDLLLVQAYQQAGETESAKSYAQIYVYLHLISLISAETTFLTLHVNDLERCERTIARVNAVMEEYGLDALHPNIAVQFYYQAAVVYATHGMRKQALAMLERFSCNIRKMLDCEQLTLSGDDYFDHLDEWIDGLTLGDMAPRDRSFIVQNSLQALSNPVFADFKGIEEFQRILERIQGTVS